MWYVVLTAATSSVTYTSAVMDAQTLSHAMEHQEFRNAVGTVQIATSATCVQTDVTPTGAGAYTCVVDFADNTRQTVSVKVAADGTWVTD